MNFSSNFNKKILYLLIASVFIANFSLFVFPKKADAGAIIAGTANSTGIEVDPTTLAFFADNVASNKATTAFQVKQTLVPSVWNMILQGAILPALQAIAEDIATQIIQNLTEATVNWINNGFNGSPAYVSDIGDFLANTADQTVGQELFNDPALNFLCAPFQLQVKLALGLSYSQPFYKQINCTLTGAIGNVTNFINNDGFTSSGGWSNWLQISTQPQNNPTGAFLIAKANIDA